MVRLLVALVFVSTLASCGSQPSTTRSTFLQDTSLVTPEERYTNVSMIYSDSANPQLRLSGPLLERYEGDSNYTLFPKGIHVEFFNDKREVDSKVTSKWAVQYQGEEMMEARDSVVVVNRVGEQLNTQHLIWNSVNRTFYTDSFVTITTPDEVIFGDGLEANEDFTRYKILNIRGTFLRDDEEYEDDYYEESE